MDAHNHNLRADTIPVNRPHSTISHLKLNKEVEHGQENAPHIREHTQMINLLTSKTGHHQVTHVGTTTNNANAMNDVAEKKNRELINYMKKKVVEGQTTRKKKKTENAKKNDDAKCNDAPTA
jgi:chemotaxis regulatin CheY-phosphate phosphatase CheZ